MTFRKFVANGLPPVFSYLQAVGLLPNPANATTARRMGHWRPGDHYKEHVSGRYRATEAGHVKFLAHDALSQKYATLVRDSGRNFCNDWPFGFYEAENVKLWPKFGVFSTQAGNFLDVYCSAAALGNPKYELPRQSLRIMPASKILERGIFIAAPWYHNYYHWLIDLIPRLGLVQEKLSDGIPVIVPANLNRRFLSLLRVTLDRMGFENSKIVELEDRIHMVDHLVMPTSLSMPFDVSPRQRDFLRQNLLPTEVKPTRRRIYVSRRDAVIRRISNEPEILTLLAKAGFEVVTLSTMTVPEQARLFAEAEAVVGHHGAGLSNLSFCESGTRVIEIFQDGHFSPSFARMAQIGGLDYALAVGDEKDRDTYVNPAHVSQLLDQLGLS